jgi:hypothetical protein
MSPLLSCPETTQLQRLVHGDLPADEQAELTGHLDTCTRCQELLEELAAGSAQWARRAPRPGDTPRPAPGSAFWPALRAVEREVAAAGGETSAEPRTEEALSLDFLSPPEEPGTLGKLDHFHVERVIGRGGMGVVLRALDSCLERRVAIKLLDPQLADNETAHRRFCREARAAAAVTHDHVVAMHYVEEFKGLPYLVMQHVEGESLQDRLDRSGPLPARDVARIGHQTAAGLAAAHAQGLIHRDIKPANILLEKVLDRVKITDFGLARAVEDVKLTQSGFVAGTPLYMAPEQAKGEPLDARTDLFSLGSVLYACCTGRAPFAGSTPFLVLRQVTEETPTPIEELNPDVPEELVAVIDRLMEKRPEDRFQSAAEVAEQLGAIHARMQAAAPAAPAVAPSRPAGPRGTAAPATRRWLRAAALAVPVFLVGLAVGYAAGRRAPSADETATDHGPSARAALAAEAEAGRPVAFSADGKTLAAAGGPAGDGPGVTLYDVPSGKQLGALPGATDRVQFLAFAPDGRTLATGSAGPTDSGAGVRCVVKLWEISPGSSAPLRLRAQLEGPEGDVRAIAFLPDGTLAAAGRDGAVRRWDKSRWSTPAGR